MAFTGVYETDDADFLTFNAVVVPPTWWTDAQKECIYERGLLHVVQDAKLILERLKEVMNGAETTEPHSHGITVNLDVTKVTEDGNEEVECFELTPIESKALGIAMCHFNLLDLADILENGVGVFEHSV